LYFGFPSLLGDAASARNFIVEIARSYTALLEVSKLPEEELQYNQVSEWLNALINSEEAEAGKEFWKAHSSPLIVKPRSRGSQESEFPPGSVEILIDDALKSGIDVLAERYGSTASAVLLGCWYVLLGRLTDRLEINIATAFDGRTEKELKGALGLFARYLPLTCQLRPEGSFAGHLLVVTEALNQASLWQECFADPRQGEQDEDVSSTAWPFAFDYTEEGPAISSGGLIFRLQSVKSCIGRYDLKLNCELRDGALWAEISFDKSIYTSSQVERIINSYDQLLRGVVSTPEAPLHNLEIVCESERDWEKPRATPLPSAPHRRRGFACRDTND
jgi:non-ribosomal peptide synthetase component F